MYHMKAVYTIYSRNIRILVDASLMQATRANAHGAHRWDCE